MYHKLSPTEFKLWPIKEMAHFGKRKDGLYVGFCYIQMAHFQMNICSLVCMYVWYVPSSHRIFYELSKLSQLNQLNLWPVKDVDSNCH